MSPSPPPLPPPEGREGAVWAQLTKVAERYGLPAEAVARLGRLLELLVTDPRAPSSIRTRGGVLRDHLADSLVGLEYPALGDATTVLDLGSGAGLPGLPLAIALPESRFTLLESSARKCAFLERAVTVCEIANAEVVHARAESFEAGFGRYDVVTARAVGQLPVTAEYAAPLLRLGGLLMAWRGQRDPAADSGAVLAARELGLGEPEIFQVKPYERAENRHIYVFSKLRETPERFPRRPGMAAKRPLGAH